MAKTLQKSKSNPVGRKKMEVTDAMLKIAYESACIGLSNKQIAVKLGMSDTTLYERFKENPKLSDTIKAGQTKAVEGITNALYLTALEGNTTAQIFFLKNRGEWRDKQELDIKQNTTVNFEDRLYVDEPKS